MSLLCAITPNSITKEKHCKTQDACMLQSNWDATHTYIFSLSLSLSHTHRHIPLAVGGDLVHNSQPGTFHLVPAPTRHSWSKLKPLQGFSGYKVEEIQVGPAWRKAAEVSMETVTASGGGQELFIDFSIFRAVVSQFSFISLRFWLSD